MYSHPQQHNMVTDTHESVKYKVIGKNGQELAIKPSQMLAETFLEQLPDELREGARVVPITEEGKQLLFEG